MRIRNDTDQTTLTTASDTNNVDAPGIYEPLMPGGDKDSLKAPLAKFDNIKLEVNDQPAKVLDENTTLCDDNNSDGGSRDDDGDPKKAGERASWGGKLEFLFTCIGYAVGLGNVWRFPYLCYKNGGGAFLVPYILMLGLVGLPLFYMELVFGQFASLGPIAVWKINRLLKGLGYAMVAVDWLIAVYYNVVISHVMMFLFASFAAIPTGLPWVSCDNWWNTDDCIAPTYMSNQTALNETGDTNMTVHAAARHLLNGTGNPKTPTEEYYNNFVLEMSSGMEETGAINWKLALCLLLAWIIILICLIRGIQSLGKVVYFTAIFPYIMLTILLIRSATLPGASLGIVYYLKPDFSRLTDPRVWSDAATQIFYSLSACTGGLVAMASYNKFDNNCYKDALIVAIINCATSIYSGLVIFCVLGFMAQEKGVDVSHVAAGGPGLAFVVYPEALSRMPAPQLWAICFFFMMATLGFGSQLSIVECVLSAFTDEFAQQLRGKWASVTFRSGVILFTFLMGLPMCTKSGIYLLNLVDYSVSGFPLLVVGVLELAALNWIYGYERLSEDIEMMLGRKPNLYWKICWKGLSAMLIMVVILFNIIYYKPPTLDDYHYPAWAESLGWCIAMFPIVLIVGFFLWSYCRNGGFELVRELQQPTPEWGPALPQHRTGRYLATQTTEMGTQSDFTTMWTQTRIVLARTPMPSSFNINMAGTQCNLPAMGDMEAVLGAVSDARDRELNALEVVDAAAGTPDEPLPCPEDVILPTARVLELKGEERGSLESLPLSVSPPKGQYLEVRLPGTTPSTDESKV